MMAWQLPSFCINRFIQEYLGSAVNKDTEAMQNKIEELERQVAAKDKKIAELEAQVSFFVLVCIAGAKCTDL